MICYCEWSRFVASVVHLPNAFSTFFYWLICKSSRRHSFRIFSLSYSLFVVFIFALYKWKCYTNLLSNNIVYPTLISYEVVLYIVVYIVCVCCCTTSTTYVYAWKIILATCLWHRIFAGIHRQSFPFTHG